ncbi:alpha/beta hydrolase family protein [Couchioplanes caeruleus]|uniref:Acetylhydrolase n=2 Tax=Couchioplanes caeruleus TaxID=56438 RepID=A0A1K0G6A0_9ACTN|nr:acetylhydrolase [Couchioplanes caeruleus]OJF12802.1 acetylhydrolase [Couchioplanes caeruleus subsp. caeruleus]ROP33978.1 platelet-activating factor acetylhydrolase isoform II [Couchioplanes caeruleus]
MTNTTFIGGRGMTRRGMLAAALAAGAALPIGAARTAWAAPASRPARLTLPPPTGPYPVGTVPLHLVDTARPDPVAGPGRYRELMVSLWYPARDVGRHPLTPWMSAALLRELLTSAGLDPDAAAAPLTTGHERAPVRRTGGRLPVVVFSHGAHDHRSDTTIVVQELASHGYVVVTVDHTYDAFTEFPDGRLGVPLDDPALTPWDFARDLTFVLDRIEDLAAGRNPDTAGRPLPAGLNAALDAHRIGMFGWSKGATATALVMAGDERVKAGVSLDGPMQSQPPIGAELDRPFMLMTAEYTRAAEPSVSQFWSKLRGWRLNVQAGGAIHSSYCDQQWLLPQLAKVIGLPDEKLTEWIGALDPGRAVRIQQAYPLAFFDLHLRGRGCLLDGPNPAFPEVVFIA